MKSFLAIVSLILGVAFGVPALADDAHGESLEWLVVSRPHIAIAEVISTAPVRNPQTNAFDLTIQTRVKETLKGQPPQQASFIRHWQESVSGEGGAARPPNGVDYLLFFNDHGDVTNAINLRFPSRKLGVGVEPGDVAVSADFSILRSGDVIMDMVRRRLAQLAKNAAGAPAATSKRVAVPLSSPAWSVFYDGGACDLIVPADMQDKTADPEQPIQRVAEFSGPATSRECLHLPRTAFEIKSALDGQPHTLTIVCKPFPNSAADVQNMTLTFNVQDIARAQDYDFQWGSNPDVPNSPKGFFGESELRCEEMAQMLQARASKGPVPLLPAPGATETGGPMVASWKADCVPNDRWGYAVAFELNVRHAPKNAAPVPAAAPASAPAAQ